ncbi:TetR/AcrR family transcriptional regulator [Amycolatopsis thermophila]|uniref:AcrR family transcriptional regulator n=1 Tax=Amycolatopsis thermophila TaxID=206084 RepID=A0ABU0EPM5_9PSEU|nr:TetR/AcrR family transcriptional regulator [Amycolatopsis thermophila]MDQ0377250.1 AcrR family transcriptional regulator [Amycolatopsis thermophila]
MTRDTLRAASPRPLRRDAERNRLRILSAAKEVFRERGFDATLDDVAHRAGLGVGTVYRRFPNKEHLIDAMFARRLEEIEEGARAALADPDPWHGFRQFVWDIVELMATDRGIRDTLLSNAFGRVDVAQAKDRLVPIVTELVQRAKDSGKLRADFAETDCPMLFKMAASVVEYSQDLAPDLWQRYLTMLLDGLRADSGERRPLPVPPLDHETLDCAMNAWHARR